MHTHHPPAYDVRRPELLTIAETAALLRCSRRTVERLIARGEIPTVRVSHHPRLLRREVDEYLRRGRESAP